MIIGSDIPRFKIQTVELEQSMEEAKVYTKVLVEGVLKARKKTADRNKSSEGAAGLWLERRLGMAAVHPHLVELDTRHRLTAAAMAQWPDTTDHGYKFFHHLQDPSAGSPAYRERVCAALSLVGKSVKLQVFGGIVDQVCLKAKRNLVVFFRWPATQWLGELLMDLIGVPYKSIRSSHGRTQRHCIVNEFNDPQTKGTVLITTTRTSSTSLNLQANCCHMVIMEPNPSAQDTNQCVGRLHRMGQKEMQYIWILHAANTVDSFLMARAEKKMVAHLGGNSQETFSEEEIAGVVATMAAEDEVEEEEKQRQATAELLHRRMTEMYQKAYGQRTPMYERDRLEAPLECGKAEESALAEIKRSLTPGDPEISLT
jgi:hypothetical protein